MMKSHAFEKCDLFLHGCIRKDNKYGKEFCSEMYIERLPKECKVVGFPNMYGLPTFLYPQVGYNTEYKLEGAFYHICDRFVDKYYNNKSLDELCRMINTERLSSDEELQAMFESFYYKVEQREKEWDIKVLDFIKDNLKSVQLFYDHTIPQTFSLNS